MVTVCAVVRSSECSDTVGRTVMGRSQVIASTDELLRVWRVVAVEIGAESSSWGAWLLDWWAEFRLRRNWK